MDKVIEISVQVSFSNKDKDIKLGEISETFKNEDDIINLLRAMSFPASLNQVFGPTGLYDYKILQKDEKIGKDGQVKLF